MIRANDALRWATTTFRENLLAFLLLAAVVAVMQFGQGVAIEPLRNILVTCADTSTPGQEAACTSALGSPALASAFIVLVVTILVFITTVGVIRGALRATRGISPTFDALLDPTHLGKFLLTVIVYQFTVNLGVLLLILPGVLAVLFLQFAPYLVLDRGEGVFRSLSMSARLTTRALSTAGGPLALATIANIAFLLFGGMLFGLLTLVLLPIAALLTAYTYRALIESH